MPCLTLPTIEARTDWRFLPATAGLLMNRQVVTAGLQASSLELILRMARFEIDVLPIVDAADRVLGIVSRGDIVRRSDFLCLKQGHCLTRAGERTSPAESWVQYLESGGKTAAQIMTPDVIAVGESTPAAELRALMDGHRIGCLPVLRQGRLVGIVTRDDI